MESDTPKDEFKILIVASHTDPIVSRFKEAVESMKQCGRIMNFHIDLVHPDLSHIVAPRDGSAKFKTMERMLTEHMLNISYSTLGGDPKHIPRRERIPHLKRGARGSKFIRR